jgi:CelD/BcsL family acetyltransferase involved in cellulose biosynthesis
MIAGSRSAATRPSQVSWGANVPPLFQQIDPLRDARWVEFLERHPCASIFHSQEWLEALRRTYGYQPVVFTTSGPGEKLQDGVVFCKVKSWLVGLRLVSLPFSDHAEPLLSDQQTLLDLLTFLAKGTEERKWTSVELRPPDASKTFEEWSNFNSGQQFVLHGLDLRPSLTDLFRNLKKDSTQRKIRKAVREGLRYEEGRSEEQLRKFFRLSVMTRRRKALPPPPYSWFQNVVQCLGERGKIRIANTRNGQSAGAIYSVRYKDTMMFKYGASDARFHNLGTMPFLLWQAIEEAKQSGATWFDFGRSEIGNRGLIHFKDNFGAKQSLLTHKVFPGMTWEPGADNWSLNYAKKIFSILPESVLILAGKLIYPHIG